MDILKSKPILMGGLIISAVMLSVPSFAANSCKGMVQSDCKAETSCRWIDSYTRKDGKTINAYCRSNPKSKSVVKKAAKKQTDKKAS